MVARKPTAKKGEQKRATSKADKPKKHAPVKQLTLAEQTKLVKEKTSKLTLSKKIRNDKVMKVRKEKRYDLLVDEEIEEPQVEDDEYNLQRVDEQLTMLLYWTSAQHQVIHSQNVVRDTPSPADAETRADTKKSNSEGDTEILNVDEERDENVSNTVALEERTVELDEGQARSDPVPARQPLKRTAPSTTPLHIDLTPPKPVSPPAQEPVFTATTTTTPLLSPPPPLQQSTTDPVEEFVEATTKSHKRHHDDQDPPPPPPKDSDQNKKKRHDYDASASKQPPVQKPSTLTSSDTREALSDSSKQKLPLQLNNC
ncbi:hypothetical protein Tco_0226090 [Tanacetum coccineum]